jgi:hypothetical protein
MRISGITDINMGRSLTVARKVVLTLLEGQQQFFQHDPCPVVPWWSLGV